MKIIVPALALTLALGILIAEGVGAKGIPGPNIVKQATPRDSRGVKDVSVSCPLGEALSGGGAKVKGGRKVTALKVSEPRGGPGTRTWHAVAVEVAPTRDRWKLVVFAVCLT